jgi:hypothetical protein
MTQASLPFQSPAMLLVAILVPFVVLTTRVVAGPTVIRDPNSRISLSFSRHIESNGNLDLFQRDKKHRKNLVQDYQRRGSSTPDITVNDTAFIYLISVGIGEPPNSCESYQLPHG